MDRRRVITSVAVMVTMGAAAALSYPALATTTPTPPVGPASAGTVQLAPAMIAALQRDLHLTADQVGARIKKETWATRTVQTLKQTVGSAYAGAWLNADASLLTVAVTDQSAAGQVRAAGAQPAVVANSESQLAAVKQTLDRSEPEAAAGNACNQQTGTNHRGSLQRAGAVQVQPNGGFFRTTAAGTNAACLRGPANTNFDLVLQQFNGRRWQTVASATTASSTEQLTFSGAAGVYRYVVVSNGGSGTYALSITTP